MLFGAMKYLNNDAIDSLSPSQWAALIQLDLNLQTVVSSLDQNFEIDGLAQDRWASVMEML